MSEQNTPPTIRQAREQAIKELSGHNNAAIDIEVLLMHCCAIDRGRLWTLEQQPLTAEQYDKFQRLLQLRHQGHPIAHLTGEKEFWSLPFAISPNTLIPRPETELLVEQALLRIPKTSVVSIADLGTGSGNIAAAIGHERPDSEIIAIDIDVDVLSVARQNFENLGLMNIGCLSGSWCEPLGDRSLNIIVSNPPYIAEGDPHLHQGDVAHEPGLALVAGSDGLSVIRVIIEQARQHLEPGGWLLLEHGFDQQDDVGRLFLQQDYINIQCYRDLSGHPRVTEGQITTS
ncbi:MAG: peptide chain release factor N(5)-glutamine methyltransferase [Gammaproteobacteria bacterium]|nr:MAG: peptide chain release factor N(5)-glutamine methyltransferase [Gammaproteobacteria bacterium]